jgi:hypothetical protein
MTITYIHTYRNSPKRGTLKGANKRLMGNIQEATDTKSESSVEHDMNSSSTSEAGQLPADPIDKKHSEIVHSTTYTWMNQIAPSYGRKPRTHCNIYSRRTRFGAAVITSFSQSARRPTLSIMHVCTECPVNNPPQSSVIADALTLRTSIVVDGHNEIIIISSSSIISIIISIIIIS